MKSFKQFVTEGKYDQLKKELLDTEGIGNYIFFLKELKNKYGFNHVYRDRANGDKLVIKLSHLIKPDISYVNDDKYIDIYNWEKNLKGYNVNGDAGYSFANLESGAKVIDVVVPDDDELFTKNVEIKFDNTVTENFKKRPMKFLSTMTFTFPFFRAKYIGNF
jgi:hypothetical protein